MSILFIYKGQKYAVPCAEEININIDKCFSELEAKDAEIENILTDIGSFLAGLVSLGYITEEQICEALKEGDK